MAVDYEKERLEAIEAGTAALTYLRTARSQLGGARAWGIWDLFGGGLFASIAKHGKMNDAQESLNKAKAELQNFRRELQDLDRLDQVDLRTGDFIGIADVVFDGLFADLAMQNRISEARAEIDRAITGVEEILEKLQQPM